MERFRFYLRVRYGECDAQKVVFHSRYADYVDVAVGEYFRVLGYEKEMQTGELDFQLVRQTTQWHAPARYDQVLDISIAASHTGNTSFALRAEFRIAGSEDVIVTVESVYVHVDTHTLKKMPLPERLREALTRGADGHVCDHAGYFSPGRHPS
jgi:acyl-CoA thioester hydrolase